MACSGESVTFTDMSKTRIDPRSMVTRCFAFRTGGNGGDDENEEKQQGTAENEEQSGEIREKRDEKLFHRAATDKTWGSVL